MFISVPFTHVSTRHHKHAFPTFHCADAHERRIAFRIAAGLSEKNLPVLGMWVYTTATTLLVTADGIDYYNVEGCETYIKYGQIFGATLLLVGSLMYAYWSRPHTYLPSSLAGSSSYDAIN